MLERTNDKYSYGRNMTTFSKQQLLSIIGLVIIIYSYPSSAQGKTDFLNKYDLYYFDSGNNFTKNGKVIEKGGDKFTPDILYSDGSFLSSYSEVIDKVQKGQGSIHDVIKSSTLANQNKLFFKSHIYESYYGSESVLRDGDFIYYIKCMKLEYNKKGDGNCCTKTALYANDDRVDEADIESDVLISVGFSNIHPLFVKNGILYYVKTVGEESNFYSYDPTSKTSSLYNPNLFLNNDNNLQGILDNGDVIFRDSAAIFKNNLQSKIIDIKQIGYAIQSLCVGNDFYYISNNFRDDLQATEGTNLFKNNLLIAKAHSNTMGRMIDAEEQDCHFTPYIYTYHTLMYCIHKKGTIVRLDKRTKEKSDDTKTGPTCETDVAFFINNDVIDFSHYWLIRGLEKNIASISFIYNVKGNVSFLVVNAFDEKGVIANVYLVPYLGDGKIGYPELLVSNANLFGVVKKISGK